VSWTYIRPRGENLYTVGFYAPDGQWNSDADFDSREEARERVNYLNGGTARQAMRAADALDAIAEILETKSIQVVTP